MSDPPPRPPYGAALGVTALVLLGYVLTLAPTVTFWDAGELIAAAKILGIPHPPGTPLFVMMAHVWAAILPVGEYAVRTNLLSAIFSASAAGFFFLIAHETLRAYTRDLEPAAARWLSLGGGAAAAVAGAFTFTNWQNSNETEVYSVATFTIAAMAWTAHAWRRHRGTARAPKLLLLIVYLAGISVGNHLLALLAGPGLVAFLLTTLHREPARDPAQRRGEWAQVAVVAGVWALLIGTGLGSTSLVLVGGLCFAVAAAFAIGSGAGGFALLSLAIAAVGVTPYLFLYLRSAQNPMINEAAPATLDALLAVIRRAQYPVRTPLDDPTVAHGPENPGRSLLLLGIQVADYLVYFSWQWAKGLREPALQVAAAVLFAGLGLRGSLLQRRGDRAAWWLLFALFLMTGLGLVLYMNFRPGFGRWYERFPQGSQHEVRERDYFFVMSFVVWGVWAGLGLASTARGLLARGRPAARLAPLVLAGALLPPALNWQAASRRHGPDATLAADFAYDLLNSVPPYGVLFTYGDNDTFPLWWGQEVAGIRRDVVVVCLALANTDWYMAQLRDNPTRPIDLDSLPPVWKARVIPPPDWPLHQLSDTAIVSALGGYVARDTQRIALGPISRTLPPGVVLYPNDILSLSVVQQNIGRRPIVWSITTGRDFEGLGEYVVQRGLGYELLTSQPDSSIPGLDFRRLSGAPLDIPSTERLLWETYRYGGLLQGDVTRLESTSASFAATLSLPYTQLVYAYADRGDRKKLERAVERAIQLSPNPELRAALREFQLGGARKESLPPASQE